MKKGIGILLSLTLAVSLAACGGQGGGGAAPTQSQAPAQTEAAGETEKAAGENEKAAGAGTEEAAAATTEKDAAESQAPGVVPEYLEIFSGSQGGSWYQVGAQLAAIAQEATGVTSKVAAGGGAANPDTLQDGQGYFALVYSGVGYQAYLGEGDYTEPHDELNAVISMYSLPFLTIALRSDDSINSIYDLADKDLSLGKAGQTGYVIAQAVLGAHGIDLDGDSFTGMNSMLGDSERMDMLRDRQLDAITGLLPLDNSTLQSMSMTPGIKLIDMDPAVMGKVQEAVPGLEKITIPAKAFDEYQETDIQTLAAITSLYCRKDLDEELVYNFTKAIYEQAETLYQYYGEENSVIKEDPLAGIDEDMPIHPGAERFYKEIGVIQ